MTDIVREDVEAIVRRQRGALDHLAGATVLVTGAAGFLPSFFVDALAHANDTVLTEPCRILCVDNFITGEASRLAHLLGRDDVVMHEQDLTTELRIDEDVDYVVHGASIASPVWYREHPLETIDVNVNGTRLLLELAKERGARVFLYLSSSEIYGDPPPDRVPTPETYWGHVSSTGPRACYDESKRLAETLTVTYHDLYGLPYRIVRPFNVYGPRLRLDDGRIVPDLLKSALAGEPIVLYSDGRATRSFCYVADFAEAMLLLLTPEVPDGAYNVGNDDEVSIEEVARTFDEVAGEGRGVRFAANEDERYLTDNPQRRCPDLTKVKATVPWRPVTPLREGLARTHRSYLDGVRR